MVEFVSSQNGRNFKEMREIKGINGKVSTETTLLILLNVYCR